MMTGIAPTGSSTPADLAGGGDVAVFADLGATAHQGVRIDHGAVVDVSADIDVHRRHAGDVLAEICALAHATAAGHDADVLLRPIRCMGYVSLSRKLSAPHRHIDVDAMRNPSRMPFLTQALTRQPLAAAVRLSGANTTLGQRNQELRRSSRSSAV